MENLKLPNHVAIIMDGNGRWGLKNSNSRTNGHKMGVKALEKIIEACIKYGIKILTVYAFSTENWSRPKYEVDTLMWLFKKYILSEKEKMNRKGIKLLISGSKNNMPKDLCNIINKTCDYLKNNEKFTLNICFNYGSRLEIIEACNSLIADGYKTITENDLKSRLYNNIEDPDLIIRTGGDIRLSNFLLWQASYSELYFTDCLWPSFDETQFLLALESYSKRKRRYGGLNNEE